MEGLAGALGMEVDEVKGSEGEEGGAGTLRSLEALEFLTQEAELSSAMLVDSRNGFNELSRLAMICTVRHRWPAGEIFAFNCYKHWVQLLLRQPGELPVSILRREGVTQGDPFSMVLYGITRVERGEDPLILCSEILCEGDKGDPVQNHREGVTLGDSLSAQDCDWQLPRLAE